MYRNIGNYIQFINDFVGKPEWVCMSYRTVKTEQTSARCFVFILLVEQSQSPCYTISVHFYRTFWMATNFFICYFISVLADDRIFCTDLNFMVIELVIKIFLHFGSFKFLVTGQSCSTQVLVLIIIYCVINVAENSCPGAENASDKNVKHECEKQNLPLLF